MNRWYRAVWVGLALLWGSSASGADLRGDEQVVFIPSLGSEVPGEAAWDLDIHAWAFEQESRAISTFALRKALGLMGEDLDEEERTIFNHRARWFLADNERNKRILVWLDGRAYPLGKTEPDGHILARVRLDEERVLRMREKADSPAVPFNSASTQGGRMFHGVVHLVEAAGLSVISDIDDTIKISEVRDQGALLRNTFLKPFQPVTGMAEAYRNWMANDGAQFHYVSASPWQLYVPLSEFTTTNQFPAGTFHLKPFRWKDESFFNLFLAPDAYKLGVIEPILQRFPERRFVLVGDSGEKDPEVYGELARKYPKQVLRVLIRDVTNESETGERYATVFHGVPGDRWTIFDDPSKLPGSFQGK